MSRKKTKRQRLKADPANQTRSKLIAWAKGEGLSGLAFPGLFRGCRFLPEDSWHPAVKRSLEGIDKRIARMPVAPDNDDDDND